MFCKIFSDYEFISEEYQNYWRCITTHTYESMELYYRKQLTMRSLLSLFRQAFHIAPITLKNTKENKYYHFKLLAIYLLTKYSNADFSDIAKEFHIDEETVRLIHNNSTYQNTFLDDIKRFFKEIEDTFLSARKVDLGLKEVLKYNCEDETKKIYYEKQRQRLNKWLTNTTTIKS